MCADVCPCACSFIVHDMDGPVMTRTPEHSELGSQPATAGVLTTKAAVVSGLAAFPAESLVQTADKGQHKAACSAGCMSNKPSSNCSAQPEQQPEVQDMEQEPASEAMCHTLTVAIEAPQHDADDSSASQHETAGDLERLSPGGPVTALARSASSTCCEAASTAEGSVVDGSVAFEAPEADVEVSVGLHWELKHARHMLLSTSGG